jgi:hypothetical protein
MDHLQMLVLTTGSRDEAVRTLEDIKGLEHAGWIELTDYAVLGPDPQGGVHVYESACAAEPKSLTDGEWPRSLAPAADGFALAVVTADQYAERVAEELESRGRTVRGHLRGRECRMALRGAVERAKTNLEWLQGVLHRETEKAERLAGLERDALESTIAAGRAELGAEQEVLQARLRVLADALEGELREIREQPRDAGVEARIEEIEGQLAECREDLVNSILDHMEGLARHASELQVKFAQASPEAADVIDAQLHELQVRMRRNRSELTATLGESSARLRRQMDQLRVEALGKPAPTPDIEERIKKLRESQQTVKADIRRLEKEGSCVWHGVSWQALRESAGRAERASW